MTERTVYENVIRSVAELIKELKKLPKDTVPITREPPFDGCCLFLQPDGKVLLASPEVKP
jgi:hypothetical protein